MLRVSLNVLRIDLRWWLVVVMLGWSTATAAALGTWNFTVLLDGREIGEHTFRVSGHGEQRSVVSEARFRVRLLVFDAFSYSHDASELWQGSCLARIETKTNQNGKTYAVSGELGADGFRVTGKRGAETLPGCIMSFAYWNPDILKQRSLLNVQTGELLPVQVREQGPDVIETAEGSRSARRYELTGEKLRITLWYGPDGRWLGLESLLDGGRRLRYVLQ